MFHLVPLVHASDVEFVLPFPFPVSEFPHVHGDGAFAEGFDGYDGFPPFVALEDR